MRVEFAVLMPASQPAQPSRLRSALRHGGSTLLLGAALSLAGCATTPPTTRLPASAAAAPITLGARTLAELDAAVAAQPKDAALYAARAWAHLQVRQYDAAIADCTRALELDAFHARAYSIRARARLEKPRAENTAALLDAQRGAVLESSALSLSVLGAALLTHGQLAEAIECYNRVIVLDPQDWSAFARRGAARWFSQDHTGGQADLEVALRNGAPRLQAEALATQADAMFILLRDVEAALLSYDRALALAPDYAVAYAGRSNVRRDQRPPDLAGCLSDAREAVRLSPESTLAYNALAVALAVNNDSEGAMAAWDRALALDPTNPNARASRAQEHLRRGRITEAEQDITEALRIAPRLPDAQFARARLRMMRSDFAGAIADIDRALALAPGVSGFLLDRSLAKSMLPVPDWQGARMDADQAIMLGENSPEAYALRGFTRLGSNDIKGATGDADRALARNPQLARGHELSFQIKVYNGEFKGALTDCDTAISLTPPADTREQARLIIARGIAGAASGDLDGALQDYDRGIALHADLPHAFFYRGLLQAQRGLNEPAIADLTRCIALNADFAPAYFNRALLHVPRGDYADAIADFTRCIELGHETASSYGNRGYTRSQAGDVAGALTDLDKSLELKPDAIPARQLRIGLLIQHAEHDHSLLDRARREVEELLAAKPAPYLQALRGHLRMYDDDFAAAYQDFEASFAEPHMFARFLQAVAAQRGGGALPEKSLRTIIAEEKDGWTKTLARFMLGELTEDEFFRLAEQGKPTDLPGQRCEAFYYAAQLRLTAGDKSGARELFKRAVAANYPTYVEHGLALHELRRLGP